MNAPSLSQDGGTLIYVSPFSGHGDIYSYDSRKKGLSRLTTTDDFESWPVLSFDGTRIAYGREGNGVRHVWIINADGSAPTQLTKGNVLDDLQAITHDGSYVLFHRSLPSGGMGRTSRSYLLSASKPLSDPLSVGDRAVLASQAGLVMYSEAGAMWAFQIDSGERRRLRVSVVGEQLLDVSTDGGLILVSRMAQDGQFTFDQEIWAIDIAKGSERLVGTGHSAMFCGQKCESVFYYHGFEQAATLVPVTGGNSKQIPGTGGRKTVPRMAMEGRGIIIGAVKSPDEGYGILFIDLTTMKCKEIGAIGPTGVDFRPPGD